MWKDWIKHINSKCNGVQWFKDPFTDHCPCDIKCSCQECFEGPIEEYDEHWEWRGKDKKEETRPCGLLHHPTLLTFKVKLKSFKFVFLDEI